MSVYWYAIGNDITLSDLKTINQKLKEKKMEQLSFNHDLLIDRFWLQRTEFGKRGVMIVEDFDVETKIRILKRQRLACVKEYKKYRDEQSLNRLDAIHNNLLKLI